jgi:hypothetical protein
MLLPVGQDSGALQDAKHIKPAAPQLVGDLLQRLAAPAQVKGPGDILGRWIAPVAHQM